MTPEEYDRKVLSKAEYVERYKVSSKAYDRIVSE
jgi:hypothetical protein